VRPPSAAADNHVNELVLAHDRTVGFRYYNPITGRYISRDPIGYRDGPNVYCYVKNNPINRIDPLGLSEASGWGWSWWDVIPGVQIVHALYDTGAAIGSVTTVPIARGTMNLINGTSSGTNTIQHVVNGGTPPNTAGDEHAWKQIQNGANDIASAVPGTTFTGPVTGPNKVGYTPPVLTKPLKATEAATEGASRIKLPSPKAPLDPTNFAKHETSQVLSPETAPGRYVYVRDAEGIVHVAQDGPHMHPQVLGGGQSATAAGEISIGKGGKVTEYNNYSGTFQFGDETLDGLRHSIEAQGVKVAPGAKVGKMNEEKDRLINGNK
jgi:hypothetical protein